MSKANVTDSITFKLHAMDNKGKFLAGLLLGAAAGAAIAVFLGSDKGKQFVADVKSAAGKAGDEIKSAFNNFEEEVKSTVDKGKSFAEDLGKKARDFTTQNDV